MKKCGTEEQNQKNTKGIKMNLIAKYKCLKCKHKWEEKPGPVICPKCNHVYVKWLNLQKIMELIELNEYFNF